MKISGFGFADRLPLPSSNEQRLSIKEMKETNRRCPETVGWMTLSLTVDSSSDSGFVATKS